MYYEKPSVEMKLVKITATFKLCKNHKSLISKFGVMTYIYPLLTLAIKI